MQGCNNFVKYLLPQGFVHAVLVVILVDLYRNILPNVVLIGPQM